MSELTVQRTTLQRGARLWGGVAALGAALGVAYPLVIRPWFLHWGAGADEVERTWPGDELVPEPKINATHALSIDAPAAQVWPWLAQLGQGRGGFYSYEWIENLLGLDIHNADRILPEWQNLKVGDRVPLAAEGFGIPVALLEPERHLVLHLDTRTATDFPPVVKAGEFLNVSWGLYVEPRADETTRLVERWRVDWSPTLQNTLFYRLLMEPGAFIMERKLLLGVKQRAEALLRTEPQPDLGEW